jgi:hypothetical protein
METAIPRTRRLGGCVVAWLVAAGACADAGADGSAGFVVRDSAGVHIAETTRPSSEAPGWSVGDTLFTIGGGDDADLFDVAGGILLPGGDVAVAMGGTSEVRFYDGSGALRGAFGGRGDGPGEFRLLAGIGRAAADTVWAYDYGAARVSLLTPGGGVVGSVTLRPPLGAGIAVGRRMDGSVVVGQLWGSAAAGAAEVEGLVRDASVYARYAPDGSLLDTIGLFPGREVVHRLEGARMTMGAAPFARSSSHALLGDDLVVGDQVRRELSVVGAGPTLRVRWSGPPPDVTRDEVEAWKEAQIAAAEAADRPSVRAWLADVPLPKRRPAYGAFLVGAAGALWVADYAGPDRDPTRWNVFDAEGRHLGAVDMPARFRLLDVTEERVLGVARDALDVERLEVRRLVRPHG